jgi:two-component system chemotaxis response regulator CheY
MSFVRPRLLLVDDDDDMRRMLGSLLAATFEVVESMDGRDAITKLEAIEVAAILTDLVMPRVDGAALVDWIAANRPHLFARTFVITGGATIPRLKQWLATFDQKRVFLKPCEPEVIVACIAATLENS